MIVIFDTEDTTRWREDMENNNATRVPDVVSYVFYARYTSQ